MALSQVVDVDQLRMRLAGLDTGGYSFAYVARWSEGATELI